MDRKKSPIPVRPVVVAVAVGLLVLLAYQGWGSFGAESELPTVESAQTPATGPALDTGTLAQPPADPADPVETPPVAQAPAIENPVEDMLTQAPEVPLVLPALMESDAFVTEDMSSLLGRKNLLTFVQADGLVRRLVATVDNLARAQASSKLWPVTPTPNRFATRKAADGVETIHPDNHKRYTPLVNMVNSVSTDQALALYRKLYPLFQQAYEELGFPNRYFNDRVVEVLDHLIATPVPKGPLAVTLVEVKGEIKSLRPWVRYEYADPDLQAMSAGRKILMRMGPAHQRTMQEKLKEFRQKVAKS